jgi:hypothetical protein
MYASSSGNLPRRHEKQSVTARPIASPYASNVSMQSDAVRLLPCTEWVVLGVREKQYYAGFLGVGIRLKRLTERRFQQPEIAYAVRPAEGRDVLAMNREHDDRDGKDGEVDRQNVA